MTTVEWERYSYLDVRVADGIARVTLDRPEEGNAYGPADHHELACIASDLAADDRVRVALVTGAGKAFSVGANAELADVMESDEAGRARVCDEARTQVLSLIDLDKPVVVALNGVARGAALAFALLGDIIIADRDVAIGDFHVGLGLVAGDQSALTWPLSVGLVKAKRYLLTGDNMSAEEAERLGLITEIAEPGQALARATVYAERLAAGPRLAIQYTKRTLNQWLREGFGPVFDVGLALEQVTLGSEEFVAARRRLTETRQPAIPPDRS